MHRVSDVELVSECIHSEAAHLGRKQRRQPPDDEPSELHALAVERIGDARIEKEQEGFESRDCSAESRAAI